MRKERDSLGEMELPDDAIYGVQTKRAMDNFRASGLPARIEMVRAYVTVKKAAAMANMEIGDLEEEIGIAIVTACNEILDGRHMDQFPVDVFQAGAGTSFNMNVNEVVCNLALEIMGFSRGDYRIIGPNDHVNMSQSTNDTYPTASHMAILDKGDELLRELDALSSSFEKKGIELRQVAKSGRTHLMDALPIRMGNEFGAYASAVRRARGRIGQRLDDLLELSIGGSAVGTGANTGNGYRNLVIENLSMLSHRLFISARDPFEALQSRSQMLAFSSSLRELALELIRIANDLRLLNSGPTTGLAELTLPAVQPGSSMMPGKVNPVMAECLDMVCFQVLGNDATTVMAAQAGQLELNVMTPVMTYDILESLNLLIRYLPDFRERCVDGITANTARCASYIETNPILATLLSERIGYLRAAELVKESTETGVSVPALAVKKKMLTKKEAKELFDPIRMSLGKYD
ncbi:MAG TPA: aspartate ammonia-lyase [Methanomassiliicoccales archaeon]|jgi:aspartate ammonia-lyase